MKSLLDRRLPDGSYPFKYEDSLLTAKPGYLREKFARMAKKPAPVVRIIKQVKS